MCEPVFFVLFCLVSAAAIWQIRCTESFDNATSWSQGIVLLWPGIIAQLLIAVTLSSLAMSRPSIRQFLERKPGWTVLLFGFQFVVICLTAWLIPQQIFASCMKGAAPTNSADAAKCSAVKRAHIALAIFLALGDQGILVVLCQAGFRITFQGFGKWFGRNSRNEEVALQAAPQAVGSVVGSVVPGQTPSCKEILHYNAIACDYKDESLLSSKTSLDLYTV